MINRKLYFCQKKKTLKKYKNIFWDLDRTIWDFEKNSLETFKEIYTKHNLQQKGIKSFDSFMKTYRKHNIMLWGLYRKGEIEKEKLSVDRFRITLEEFGIENLSLAIDMSVDYLKLSPEKTNLFPYAHTILVYLSNTYRMHIITNGFKEVQYKKIRNSNLEKYFDKIIISEEIGYKKPDKNFFKCSLEKANAKAEESIVIGDDLNVDIIGARNAGIDQIFFNNNKIPHTEKITYEISSLLELKKIL